MKRNNAGYLALTVGSIGILAIGFAQSGGLNPLVPDHGIVTRPISMKDTAMFRDASTLWLTSNMETGGTVQMGRAKKFVKVTIVIDTLFLDALNSYIYRKERWESAAGMLPVGPTNGEPRAMTASEHLAAMIMFNRALVNRNIPNMPVADENGIRGTVHPADVGLTPAQLVQLVDAKRQQQMQYLAGGPGGRP